VSVMSAAEARQAAGAGHQITVPGQRAANSARDRGGPSRAGYGPGGGPCAGGGLPLPPAGRRAGSGRTRPGAGGTVQPAPVGLAGHGFEVSELRMTQVRTVRAGRARTARTSAVRAQAVRASASQVAAGVTFVDPHPAVHRAAPTGYRPGHLRPARPGAVRLTRRGRRVVAGLAIALTAVVVALIWLAAAGGAAASDHGAPARAAYQGLTQVVVRPGQTLWSIAAAAEPSADPRVVIQQIIEANALTGATIHSGQLLWVPEG
jgi:hypothetical protein